jgi:hypothetical protein
MKPLNPYLKTILTVIAACLLWLCFLTTLDHSPPARAAIKSSELHLIECAEGSPLSIWQLNTNSRSVTKFDGARVVRL